MKVLHLLASNKYSGAENVVCTMINCFRNDINMAYCSPLGEIKEILEEKKIKYYGITEFNIIEINKIIKKYNPDILYTHDFKASILAAMLKYNGKIISHIHKNDPAMKKISIKSLIYRLCSTKFYKVVGVSQSILDEYIFKKSIKNKFKVFYNFIDYEEVIKKSKEFKPKKKYNLCYVGRLSPEKNPLLFIELVKKLNDKENTTAILVGDGILKDKCIKKVKEYQLEGKIDLVGFQKNPYPYIANSDICIMPSQFEGFGLVAIESMILNTPVFNSGAGGLKEIFKNNNYYICNNIDEYVNKVYNYLNNKKELNDDLKKIISPYTNKNEWKKQIKELFKNN